ncbi:MAG: hypothetical protein R2824_21965 [Saprospiraceae bacterium]|nr:hypothetical protein [Lewinella sp.]
MTLLRNVLIVFSLLSLSTSAAWSQCQTWTDSDRKEEAENAHVVYRPFVKDRDAAALVSELDDANFNIAFNNWKTAYEIAPAADGQRPSHYVDGRKLYRAMMQKATDEAKKTEYAEKIISLYDEQMACYKNEGYLTGRKAFDMFYMKPYGYSTTTYETFKKAIDLGGNDTEYIIYDPLGMLMAYLYKSGKITKEDFIQTFEKVEAIATHNIENNKQYGQYHDAGFQRMQSHISEVESEIFDCAYFKKKLLPQYEQNSEDLEIIKYVYNKLKVQGCDENDPELAAIEAKYEKLATEINAGLEIERRQNNPCYDATQLQKEGKFGEAIARYQECLNSAEDDEAKAQVLYSIAFIQTWELGQLGTARTNANKAAALKGNWGKPYILIGDIYSKMSRGSCDDWNKRLAVLASLDKYQYAKSIDPEVADDANKRISNLSGALPTKEEGFMRKVEAGQTVTAGCGIGEKVRMRYQ